MEVHILKENLSKGISAALKFTSSRTQMPILANVLIEAGDKGVYVSATNLDVGLKLRIAGKVVQPGSVVVSARVLSDLVSHLPLGGVKMSVVGDSLSVSAGGVRARLQCGQVEDFPPFMKWSEKMGEMEIGPMMDAFSSVGFAVSADEARPVLTGFLWLINDGGLVATDGYRLSIVDQVKAWTMAKKHDNLLVPGKAMTQAMQTFDDFGITACDFEYSEKTQQLLFSSQDLLITVRMLSGDYPQYEAILPKGSTIEAEFSRGEILEAVRAAAIFARDSANIVKLSLKEGKASISANTAQVGENSVELDGEVKKDGEILIAFNSKYLVDFLSHSAAERITVGLTDSLRPGLFCEAKNPHYRHVIMPVRVRDLS
jgi:DNA polymerase III subunit beta